MVHSLILLVFLSSASAQFDFKQCSLGKSCWFQPANCMTTASCVSGVEWEVRPAGVFFTLHSFVADLNPAMPVWMAVGLSHNQKMDDDTVLECVHRPDGEAKVRLSFNDDKHNAVIQQASALLSQQNISFQDGALTCSALLSFSGRDKLGADQFKVHDLRQGPYYLLFARGNADPFTLDKYMHSIVDGTAFPWTSEQTVSLCGNNCEQLQAAPYEPLSVTRMFQTEMSRYWRYRIAVLHGAAMLLGWWVLGSNAILMARYFKPLFPRKKLFGVAVWFQFHRDMMVVAVILEVIAVLIIFWQAGWVWLQCSYECNSDDFAKRMHAVTGFSATTLAVLQPFIALIRPAPDASNRPIFNWGHWLVGMTAWSLASATFIMALPLGKTGLNRTYGHIPNLLMGLYIFTFCITNVILEIITTTNSTSTPRAQKIGSSDMVMATIHGPSTEANEAHPTRTHARLAVFGFHLLVSLTVAITITVMLVRAMIS